jgi:hypothetical protein
MAWAARRHFPETELLHSGRKEIIERGRVTGRWKQVTREIKRVDFGQMRDQL